MLILDNGYSQVVSGPTRRDTLRPESSLISCNILPGISDHTGVLLEVGWDEIFREPKVERIVHLYNKADIFGFQGFLREKFYLLALNCSSVEEVWTHFKDIIFEGIKRSFIHPFIH